MSSKSRHFDVFNGDADGLCALQQLRLAEPKPSILITGAKRDNALLARVPARSGDTVTVLDVALGANRGVLLMLLGQGVEVEYFDHHHAADLPSHRLLHLDIDTAPGVCTSVLVNRHLEGRYRAWAVVGAFGDNMPATAAALAASIGLEAGNVQLLKALGESLNYNAYGDSEADLTIPPAMLFRRMAPYADPLEFMQREDVYVTLVRHQAEDMALAMAVAPMLDTEHLLVVMLPDAPWARRVVGSYANRLANDNLRRICAILVANSRRTLSVSLRTPEGCGVAADELARRYGGDGRATAAGVNNLPPDLATYLLRDLQHTPAVSGA